MKVSAKEALLPAAIVSGNDTPLTENGALVEGAEEIVTLAPLALSVAVIVLLVPAATFPKLREDGEIVNWPVCVELVPVPVSVTLALEPPEEITMLPDTEPAVLGAKLTLNVALCPAANI